MSHTQIHAQINQHLINKKLRRPNTMDYLIGNIFYFLLIYNLCSNHFSAPLLIVMHQCKGPQMKEDVFQKKIAQALEESLILRVCLCKSTENETCYYLFRGSRSRCWEVKKNQLHEMSFKNVLESLERGNPPCIQSGALSLSVST